MRFASDDESGAVLVFSAIALVALLGISALVLDIGIGHVEQRKLQNAADAAALGAAQDLPNLAGSTAPAVNDAEGIAAQNLPTKVLPWSSIPLCSGAALSNASSSPCISFGSGFTQIRVRIPRQTFGTLFGGILGFSKVSTSKVATATLKVVGNGSGLEPFMMPSGFSAGAFCLDSGGNGNSAPPCTGSVTGNFGLLDFTGCPPLNNNLDDDVASGADHFYSVEAQQGVGDIADDCSAPGPNTVAPAQGNKDGQETPAMTDTLNDGTPGRLLRSPNDANDFQPSWETISTSGNHGVTLDNRPLWEFIPSTIQGSSYPDHCARSTFTNLLSSTPSANQQVTMNWALDRCIFEYTCGHVDTFPDATSFDNWVQTLPSNVAPDACTGPRVGAVVSQCGGGQCRSPIFNMQSPNAPALLGLTVDDIVESPRFVYVPQVWQTDAINGNSGVYEVKAFRPVFIQGTGPNNGTRFEPGPWNTSSVTTTAANITSFVFPSAISGCTPSATDSCGTMLGGTLGAGQIDIGSNAVVELIG